MPVPTLEERSLDALSKIRVRYFVAQSRRVDYYQILVVKFIGDYGHGCEGNPDADFMLAMVEAGKAAFPCNGVIYDLSDLSYEWGDAIEQVFVGPTKSFGKNPVAIVVGPRSEKSIRTLCLGVDSQAPLESIGWVFRDLESAWAHVESRIITDELLVMLSDLHKQSGT